MLQSNHIFLIWFVVWLGAVVHGTRKNKLVGLFAVVGSVFAIVPAAIMTFAIWLVWSTIWFLFFR